MAQFPPKAPGMPQNWPSFSYQMMQMPSSVAQPPRWVDEFLDFSSSRRNSHRRSVSDPIAFIEAPNNFIEEECRNVSINIINAASATTTTSSHIGFDRLDDEQLSSMFSDDVATAINLAPSSTRSCTNSSNPSSPTSDDQLNSDNYDIQDQIKPNSTTHHAAEQAVRVQQQPKNEPDDVEEEKADGGDGSPAEFTDPDKFSFQANSADAIVDPKRVKRILANRQSAQRSRVRKLQYISELERSVTTLQREVSALSPRVAFLDHQRLILNVDNSALKQRIAALAQDKIFKDAHQEALRKEIERLRKVYHEQNLKNMGGADRATSSPPPEQEQPTPTSFNKTSGTTADEDQ